jgi:hypothetical protein
MYVQYDLDILLLSEEKEAIYKDELQSPPLQIPVNDVHPAKAGRIVNSTTSEYTTQPM